MSQERRVCPFCREAFEGESRCPDHDLELVSEREVDGELEAAAAPPSAGRAAVMAASVVASISFFLPFFVDAEGRLPSKSALAVALAGGESLWVSFLAPVAALGVLASVREPRALRRIRFALVAAATFGAAAAGIALTRGVELTEAGDSTIAPGFGAFVLLASLVAMGLASLRLGR